jgi:hypothetical protein
LDLVVVAGRAVGLKYSEEADEEHKEEEKVRKVVTSAPLSAGQTAVANTQCLKQRHFVM